MFREENCFSGQLVTVLDAHLALFDETELLQGAQMVRNQLLALFQSLCEFGLGWEFAHWAIGIQQSQDLSLQTVWVRGEGWDWKFLFAHAWIHGVGERVVPDQASIFAAPDCFLVPQGFEGGG